MKVQDIEDIDTVESVVVRVDAADVAIGEDCDYRCALYDAEVIEVIRRRSRMVELVEVPLPCEVKTGDLLTMSDGVQVLSGVRAESGCWPRLLRVERMSVDVHEREE